MTLPTSGPISLQDIATEFGGSHPLSMSNYYAGGSFVPSGTTGTNGPVPTSGPLSLTNFYGTKKFAPVTHTYRNSGGVGGTETVPTGASHLVVKVVASGAGGAQAGTLGGGSGGTETQSIAVSPADWGVGLTYSAANAKAAGFDGGPASVTGTLAAGAVNCTASGGQVNGPAGTPGGNNGTLNTGGAAPLGDGAGAGGNCGPGSSGQPSVEGEVIFQWT